MEDCVVVKCPHCAKELKLKKSFFTVADNGKVLARSGLDCPHCEKTVLEANSVVSESEAAFALRLAVRSESTNSASGAVSKEIESMANSTILNEINQNVASIKKWVQSFGICFIVAAALWIIIYLFQL
jgi:endogenous inhibitor of DNA gyrase (YacG/DUF329 family)